MISYWSNFPTIARQLQQVRTILAANIQTSNPALQTALSELATNGGKMLRPAFFLLFASLAPQTSHQQTKKQLKVAASLEILHLATLIHDDIIDDSPKRRGQVSIQTRFGKDVAVYAGDLLFTVFFELLLETMPPHLLKTNAATMKAILHGEINQMNYRYQTHQSLDAYMTSIENKTAALFALACYEGAVFAECDDHTCQLAHDIGKNIGIAFQIMDDILDYDGDATTLNKPVLEDLATGVYSLPVLLANQLAASEVTPLLELGKAMTKQDMLKLQTIVKQCGALKQAKQLAQNATQNAVDDIAQLPDCQAKKALIKLTNHLLKRQQ